MNLESANDALAALKADLGLAQRPAHCLAIPPAPFPDVIHGLGRRRARAAATPGPPYLRTEAYPTQGAAIRQAADAYVRTRLTPDVLKLASRWLHR